MLAYSAHDLGRQQRVAPEVEEIVVAAHTIDPQHLLPDLCERALQIGGWGLVCRPDLPVSRRLG